MASISEIKKGVVIKHQNDLWVVTSFNFVNPGKGSAFTKTKMRSISSGKSLEVTYKSSESVDIVSVSRVNMQFLYKGVNNYSFMNKDTYETVDVDADILGDDAKFLRDGLDVIAVLYEDSVVAIDLPKKVTYVVKQAPPAVKGDSASGNVTKEIILDNDLVIQAPIFIKEGEEVVVNTETGDYGGRAIEK
ncbi:MAG: elongation factor P [Candidatus Magasanikbacteria bacterium RIFCSPHIGHO2_01_FULL_33_34]|uniref:Elongation factor P n=1 Tax=Candidatus Magasanikbacteria bacterium RIFCSPHIGHO2_01_FULL_33_34 TaxID=1798671 RepID=A0A1F6LHF3_9BACT|nr:MAG: elongation factor P [Candidatus Magasanikbacteria bacterium RIFCSPHIGHO2_01_FULL_33_34]OGH66193.1 MAG: elongation factor P [Candidatus Magasanikbacteria bacterium RIFCSPHIGHO2_02_FULL_33_17]OGH76039.1 MAG: elongation factor P [Candidatus Magasanikbacteria bacterium RIFCSPLOWO2_01_FULL_33_34]